MTCNFLLWCPCWFWCQGNAGFTKCIGKLPSSSVSLEEFENIGIECFVKFVNEAVWFWAFLCWQLFDYCIHFLISNQSVSSWFSLGRLYVSAAAKSLQSCPTLCDLVDGSPPGSPVPGILQARTLEWVAISFSRAWKWKVKVKSLSRVRLLATPWTVASQAPQYGIFQARVLEWGAIAFSNCMFLEILFISSRLSNLLAYNCS